jgi:hypothetical protein
VALRSRLDSLAGFFAQGLIDAQQLTQGTKEINAALTEVRTKIGKLYDGSALAGIVDTEDAGRVRKSHAEPVLAEPEARIQSWIRKVKRAPGDRY